MGTESLQIQTSTQKGTRDPAAVDPATVLPPRDRLRCARHVIVCHNVSLAEVAVFGGRRFFSSTSAVTEGTGQNTVTTKTIAEAMDQPTNTVRRVLQGLTAYGLLARQGQGEGNADLWAPTA